MLRIIRETEPARPSARLSTLTADDLTTVAQQRHTDPPKLLHSVRGDLDWIVMKSLEKDQARRYESASNLAIDIKRHLDQKPVAARPPSVVYRARKFAQRNRGTLIATAAVVFVLALGVVTSEWQRRRVSRAEWREKEQQTLAREKTIAAAKATEDSRHILYESDQFLLQQALTTTNLDHVTDLLAGLDQAIKRCPTNAQFWNAKGVLLEKTNRFDEAYVAFSRAIELASGPPESGKILTQARLNRSGLLRRMDRFAEAGLDYRHAKGLPLTTNLPDYRSAYEVSIELGATNREDGLQLVNYKDGDSTPAQIDGMECRLFKGKDDRAWAYGYFVIDPTFKWSCGTDLVVVIEYMGAGTGEFGLHYKDRASTLNLALKKSTHWEVDEVRPRNVQFDADMNGGADFRIWTHSHGLYVRRMSITRASSEVATRLQLRRATLKSEVPGDRQAESHPTFWVSKAMRLGWASKAGEAYAFLSKALALTSNSQSLAELRSAVLVNRSYFLRRLNRLADAATDNLLALQIPPRDSRAPPLLIDLSAFYTTTFTQLPGGPENHLCGLPIGIQDFEGTEFDVRAVVHLQHPLKLDLPPSVEGIHVNLKCKRLHFLHSVAHALNPKFGLPVGRYVVRFTDDTSDVIELKLGLDLWDWWFDPGNRRTTQKSKVAWTGTNEIAQKQGFMIQLFKSTWLNPRANVTVQSIDYISANNGPAPFLIAVTAEP